MRPPSRFAELDMDASSASQSRVTRYCQGNAIYVLYTEHHHGASMSLRQERSLCSRALPERSKIGWQS